MYCCFVAKNTTVLGIEDLVAWSFCLVPSSSLPLVEDEGCDAVGGSETLVDLPPVSFFFFCDPASSLLLVNVAIGDEVEIYEVVGGKDEELRSRGENDRSCGIEVGVVVCRLGRGK